MDEFTPTKRYYCTVCSHYRGKEVNGRIVSLHRFPMNEKVKNAWIRRIKLVKKGFRYNSSQRLCSEHFVGGDFEKNIVPSVFGERRFNTTTLESISSMSLDVDTNTQPLAKPEPQGQATHLKSNLTSENSSILFHDYIGMVHTENMIHNLNKDCQTNIGICSKSIGSQTPLKDKSDASTQTEIISNSGEPYATKCRIRVCFMCCLMKWVMRLKKLNEIIQVQVQGRPRSLRLIDELFMVVKTRTIVG